MARTPKAWRADADVVGHYRNVARRNVARDALGRKCDRYNILQSNSDFEHRADDAFLALWSDVFDFCHGVEEAARIAHSLPQGACAVESLVTEVAPAGWWFARPEPGH